MAINLSRNTRAWFTTNVNAVTGVVQTTGFTSANTVEFQVLDGYSFNQQTNQQTITLSEAGGDPVRGQRSFNTALNPVDFSMSTYLRPILSGGQVAPVERVLWNALFSPTNLDATGYTAVSASTITRASSTAPQVTNIQYTAAAAPAIGSYLNLGGYPSDSWNAPVKVTSATLVGGVVTANGIYVKAPTSGTSVAAGASSKVYTGAWGQNGTAFSYVSSAPSNKNQLQKFGLVFLVDNVYYTIDNCSMNQATIDFGLDAISMVAWTGNGTRVNTQTAALDMSSAAAYSSSANYITNKLSTVTLVSNIGGQGGTSYTVPLTGGSITFNNNISYLTPENLGVVNNPIGYYTGTRAITGTMNAYLRTGSTGDTGQLMTDVLAGATTNADNKYKLQFEIGGSTNPVKVEIDLEGCMLQLPTVEIADVVSTTINFTAQGSDPTLANNAYDITNANEAIIKYYSA